MSDLNCENHHDKNTHRKRYTPTYKQITGYKLEEETILRSKSLETLKTFRPKRKVAQHAQNDLETRKIFGNLLTVPGTEPGISRSKSEDALHKHCDSKTFERLMNEEGLFTRRNSENLLSDLESQRAHLLQVAEQAENVKRHSYYSVTNSDRKTISEKIFYYNNLNQVGMPFIKLHEDLDYEGALRFYFVVDGQSELTKAVRLTNKTTVRELIPILVGKFSITDGKDYVLYENHEGEESVFLDLEECPLARAISTQRVPRFVLKIRESSSHNTEDPEEIVSTNNNNNSVLKKEKKKRLFSLNVGSKRDPEHRKSKLIDDTAKPEKQDKPKKSKKKKKSDKTLDSDVNHSEDEILSDDAVETPAVSPINVQSPEINAEEPKEKLTLQTLSKTNKSIDEDTEHLGENKVESSLEVEPEIIAAEFVAPDYSLPESFVELTEPELAEGETVEKVPVYVELEETVQVTTESVVESIPGEEASTEEIAISRDLDEVNEPEYTEEISTHRKLSFSNSSIFFDQDNDPPTLELKKDKKNKKKTTKKEKVDKDKITPEKRSKSFSNMLKSQKNKKQTDKDGVQVELSTNKLTPGILKVFGDHVSKGSNYKAVRVSTISTSQEVVRMALEKYGFENANPKDYVLCDVVGQFSLPSNTTPTKPSKKHNKNKKSEKADVEEDKPQWTTEYVRAVHENEKPLVLQSLWKPTNGRSRRFELRRRIDVESSCFFINTADTNGRRNSESSLFGDSDHSSVVSGNESHAEHKEFTPAQLSPHSKSNRLSGNRDADEYNQAPLYVPYLLLVQGFKDTSDYLIHKLDDPTNMVGPYMEGDQKQCNIALHSSDILLPHCWIYKKVKLEDDTTETNLDEINFLVFIEPANGADITVNGTSILKTTLIKPGQLIGFGKYYLYIFKDPTQKQDIMMPLAWVEKLKDTTSNLGSVSSPASEALSTEEPAYAVPLKKQVSSAAQTEDKAIQVEILEPPVFSDHTEESDDASDSSSDEIELNRGKYQAQRKQVEKSHLQLVYEFKEEEELLHTIIDIADEEIGAFKLTPAYFFMMAIEHSAATFTEIQTRKLLLKISSGLQGIAWEKTKEIGKQSSVKEEDPILLLNRVLPELKPVLFWMASSLEMLNFLQCHLSSFLLHREKVTTSKDALLTADEELLTVLEEVIMFTFQQTVYHLTKVLYVALPAIIDINPFQSEEAENENGDNKQSPVHPVIAKVIQIFTSILDAAKEFQVHSQIISQLFAYLFFFSNASLFNALMERGPDSKFYRWTKGVQMRGNLDVLEDWAQRNGLANQFEQYMGKFLSAVDLLSTPKVQLMQYEWKQLRMDYSILNPAQLQRLLGEYQLGGKGRPRGWYPPPEEVEPALRSSEILESFATHPPLMLPSSNFTLNLNKAPESEEFFKYLERINEKFNTAKINGAGTPPATVQPLKDEVVDKPKTKKTRTKSNIDMEYVQSAIQHQNKVNNAQNKEPQVGSVKSIQVQSKKTTITVSSKRTTSNSDSETAKTEHVENDQHVKENGVDDLIKHARVLINADDITSDDEDDDVDKNLSGDLNGDVDVFVVELQRSDRGLGLGLIDGMFTSLKNNGIYVRTIVPNTPASEDSRLRIGDQILAVNGTTLVGSDYSHAMELIKKAGAKLSFLIAKSDEETMNQILTAST